MVSDGSGGRGKSTTPRKASPRWVGALGPAKEERGRLVRSGDGEAAAKTGAEAAASLPANSEARDVDTMHGGGPFYSYVALAANTRLCNVSSACTRVGAYDAASSCCDGLAWRQRAHGVVL
jgi:hypothetical protein